MAWRLARSLENLRNEINEIAPNRSKASDGTIGDDPHQGRPSDHNPNPKNVVCAFDATHDPGSGADMRRVSEHLRTNRHEALKYIIWSRRIASASSGWRWTAYHGSNPHTRHMHVSVGRGPDGQSTGPYDDSSPWGLASRLGDEMIGLRKGDSGERVKGLQAVLGRAGFHTEVDGEYGSKTAAAVLKCRKSMGSDAKNGNKIDGYGYAQLLSALVKKQGDD